MNAALKIRWSWACLLLCLTAFVPPTLTRAAEEQAKGDDPIYLDEPEPTPPPKVSRPGVIPEKYEDGSMRIERHVLQLSDDQIVNHGLYTEFYRNGKKFAEGNFDMGVHDGEWTFWHDNGQIAKKVNFKKGKPDGSWEVFRADGSLLAKKQYKDGQRTGDWITYFEDGKTPKIESKFVDNLIDGVRVTYFDNGKQRQKAIFKMGVLDGLMIEWDEEGNKIGEANFQDGKLDGKLIRWGADGTKYEQSFRNNAVVKDKQQQEEGAIVPLEKKDDSDLRLLNK